MKYTIQELIEAQKKYNNEFLDKPENFEDITDMNHKNSDELAERQINHLLWLAYNEDRVEEDAFNFNIKKPGFYWFMLWSGFSLLGVMYFIYKLVRWIF